MDPSEHLPVELIRRIIELAAATPFNPVDHSLRRVKAYKRVFGPLMLVSHGWEELTRPVLYQEVVLNSADQAISLVRALDQHPEKAELIRHLEVRLKNWALGGEGRAEACSAIQRANALLKLVLKAALKYPYTDLPLLPTEIDFAHFPHLTTLELRFIELPSSPFPSFPHLANLTLADVRLPVDIPAFVASIPNVFTLEFSALGRHLESDTLLPPPSARFLLAMAPQLDVLRLQNRPRGIPIPLIKQILHLGSSLHTLECSAINDVSLFDPNLLAEAPPFSSSPPPPPLHLKISLSEARYLDNWSLLRDENLLLKRAWPWVEVPLARIWEVRPIRRVVLETWWVENVAYGRGKEVAVEKFRERGLQLYFESFSSFMQ